jgi:hypothetical protein
VASALGSAVLVIGTGPWFLPRATTGPFRIMTSPSAW